MKGKEKREMREEGEWSGEKAGVMACKHKKL